ncbi:MAG: Gfo/Idh/MocA family oxidoreductase [bacterium]|nr:Gfo/Idh/MocA family oxidoreductase [bacterium]
MSNGKVRVASLGMGWWSDVLADAVQRSDKIEIVSCYTRSPEKREAFARKYGCAAAGSYEEMLADPSIEAVINTTPNHVHLETVRAAAEAGKHVFLDKPIAHTIADGRKIADSCKRAGVVLSVGYQRRRENHFLWIKRAIEAGKFGILVQADANISRDRVGQFEEGHWRYRADAMPGGVMLQIGIHYIDVLCMLMGPIKAVSARTGQLVLPGENPDIANLIIEHENGACSNLTASYASASEYYLMNIYGKEATACYTLFDGLRVLWRGAEGPEAVPCEKNDTIREELDEFAACVRGEAAPGVSGDMAVESLAVIRAGVRSAKEGRRVEIAEILADDNE